MTMQAMVDTLVEAGFDVDKVYDTCAKGYRFTISKGDRHTSALFEYPADTSRAFCDQKQREFIDFIIDMWRKDHMRENRISDATKKAFCELVKSYIDLHNIPALFNVDNHRLVIEHKYKYDTAVHVIWSEVEDAGTVYEAVVGELKKWNAADSTMKRVWITTAGSQESELFKRMLNYTYGKYGDYRFGATINHICKVMEEENNMPTKEEQIYVRQDVQSLAAAFKRVNDAFNRRFPDIKKVIFSGPCTIVLWEDGTKTVVRCDKDVLDPEKGLAMAIAKKAFGTNKSGSNYYDIFKKWLPKEEPMVIDFEEAQNG